MWIGTSNRVVFILTGILLFGAPAPALTPAEKCEASKLGTAGKYSFCRLKAEAKAAKAGGSPDFIKCDSTSSSKFAQTESAAAGACPTNGDATSIQAFTAEYTDAIQTALAGGPLPLGVQTCNATLASCQAQPLGQRLRTGQATCYDISGNIIACAGTGQDGELQKGLTQSFVDNGDGTITDMRTGLMWEKLGGIFDLHFYADSYSWQNAFNKIAALNGVAYAGHTDWRLPNLSELQSLANYNQGALAPGGSPPATLPVFDTMCSGGCFNTTCSCTRSLPYWTSTTSALYPNTAWVVNFQDGNLTALPKGNGYYVRAVRGGM